MSKRIIFALPLNKNKGSFELDTKRFIELQKSSTTYYAKDKLKHRVSGPADLGSVVYYKQDSQLKKGIVIGNRKATTEKEIEKVMKMTKIEYFSEKNIYNLNIDSEFKMFMKNVLHTDYKPQPLTVVTGYHCSKDGDFFRRTSWKEYDFKITPYTGLQNSLSKNRVIRVSTKIGDAYIGLEKKVTYEKQEDIEAMQRKLAPALNTISAFCV